MNLVFMNSLEKKTAENRVLTAQVSISEQQGNWHVVWSEPKPDGKLEQQIWFEGAGWNEMLDIFRDQLKLKQFEGFTPLIDGYSGRKGQLFGRAKLTQMLVYYSEKHDNEAVYESLRAWRKEQATKDGKAPYMVSTNKELRLISCFLPKTKDELLQIPGYGNQKVSAYGESIFEITKPIERQTNFPLDWVEQSVDADDFALWIQKQYELKIKQETDMQKLKVKLLKSIGSGENIETIQQQYSLPRRDVLQWIERLDKEGYNMDRIINNELDKMPAAEQEKAMVAFETEGDQYLKPVYAKVYPAEGLTPKEMDQKYEWLRLLRIRIRKNNDDSLKGIARKVS